MTTWVVVADSSRGRIFAQDKPAGELQEIEDLIHPSARLREGQLTSDRPGMDRGAFGQGQRVFDARTEAHEHEAATFAKEIAERLESARAAGRYQRLILMAPPAFLGELRESLGDEVRKRVVGEVHKNLVQRPTEEVRDHLPKAG